MATTSELLLMIDDLQWNDANSSWYELREDPQSEAEYIVEAHSELKAVTEDKT